MLELPNDFPHSAPKGYRYEATESKRNVIAIWSVFERGFNYNDHNESYCIWGFYNTKKRQYHAPINSKKVGDVVDVNRTTPYTAMQLNLNGLEQLLFASS